MCIRIQMTLSLVLVFIQWTIFNSHNNLETKSKFFNAQYKISKHMT